MREIVVIRHGEAEHLLGDESLTGGWTDSVLTERGIRESHETGKVLKELLKGREYIFLASDFKRTSHTARIIGEYLDKEPKLEYGLRDYNNGVAAGMTKPQAKLIEKPMNGVGIEDWAPYDQAECWRDYYKRIQRYMDTLKDEEMALIVTHGGTAFNIFMWFLGLKEDYLGKVFAEFDTCSITWMRTTKYGEKSVYRLNDTRHLMGL